MQDGNEGIRSTWDNKLQQALYQLQDYQVAKDHPQAQVVNIEVEDLYVIFITFPWSLLTWHSRFKQRFKSLIEQYELRDLHFNSLLRTKEYEIQYHMAKFEEKRKAAEAESTRSRALNAQVLTFSKTETELRNQLNIYVEKFKQVSSSLVFYDSTHD